MLRGSASRSPTPRRLPPRRMHLPSRHTARTRHCALARAPAAARAPATDRRLLHRFTAPAPVAGPPAAEACRTLIRRLHAFQLCGRLVSPPMSLRALAVGTRVEHAKQALAKADAVCFDVDSTVIKEEGIDEFAEFLGVGAEVAAQTAAAMKGDTPFHVALEKRLNVMKPTKQKLDAMLASKPAKDLLTPGVRDLISVLQSKGKVVYLVSGGFRQMIEPIAAEVNVPKSHIYANSFLFHLDGSWKGHDPEEPTSRAGGKAKVVAALKAKHGYRTVVMVGDGATDMEARDVEGGADAFIGFGGIQVRDKVKAGADWFVMDFDEMIAVLK